MTEIETQVAETWSFCPECGMVYPDGKLICEINGAGANCIPIVPAIGQEILRMEELLTEDDGTIVRVGPFALGRTEISGSGHDQWFVKRWQDGTESWTKFDRRLLRLASRFLMMR